MSLRHDALQYKIYDLLLMRTGRVIRYISSMNNSTIQGFDPMSTALGEYRRSDVVGVLIDHSESFIAIKKFVENDTFFIDRTEKEVKKSPEHVEDMFVQEYPEDDGEDVFGVNEEDKRKYVLLNPDDYPDDPEDPRDISMGDIPALFKHTYKDGYYDIEYDDPEAEDIDDDEDEKMAWKFNEIGILDELYTYVRNTYDEHYGRDTKNQVFEQIAADGRGVDFCLGTIMKYCSRLGKKVGQENKDIMKIMHYALLLKYAHDLDKKDE